VQPQTLLLGNGAARLINFQPRHGARGGVGKRAAASVEDFEVVRLVLPGIQLRQYGRFLRLRPPGGAAFQGHGHFGLVLERNSLGSRQFIVVVGAAPAFVKHVGLVHQVVPLPVLQQVVVFVRKQRILHVESLYLLGHAGRGRAALAGVQLVLG
jgi:hypothetical protein